MFGRALCDWLCLVGLVVIGCDWCVLLFFVWLALLVLLLVVGLIGGAWCSWWCLVCCWCLM